MASAFKGLDHIGIAVRDLAAAKAAYGDILGFPISGSEVLPERGLEVVFVDTGDARLELVSPTREDSEIAKFIEKRGEGLHHICVRVPDLDKSLAEMKARGARLIDETPKAGAHNTRIAFIHPKAANSVLIELVEAKAGAGH
jgi:methylmalonyl-CoA epimerase